jgi:hypothetical protein
MADRLPLVENSGIEQLQVGDTLINPSSQQYVATSGLGTDERVVRADGTGALVNSSPVGITDAGVVTGIASIEGGLVVNELGADADFRVEGDTATNLLVVDASADSVSIGTTVNGGIMRCDVGTGVVVNAQSDEIVFTVKGYSPTSIGSLISASPNPGVVNIVDNRVSVSATEVTFNESGAATFDFRMEGDNTDQLFFIDASADSVHIGGSTIGTLANFTPTEVNFNQSGADRDLRVEGDTDANLLFVDAGADRVGIGTNAPGAKLDVRGSATFNEDAADADFRVESSSRSHMFTVDAGLNSVGIGNTTHGTVADFRVGSVVFNEPGADQDFRIESDAREYAVFTDASTDNLALVSSAAPDWESMVGGFFLEDCDTAPTDSPTNGVFLFAQDGELWARSGPSTSANLLSPALPDPQVDIFTTTGGGTWTKPTGATSIKVHLIGGGGGGGSGRCGADSTVRTGGAGGGGGGYATNSYAASSLGDTEPLNVGGGGAGGTSTAAGAASDGVDGSPGAASTFSSSGNLVTAGAGSGGAKGTTSAASGGSGGTGGVENGATGASSVATATFASPGGTSSTKMAGAGGGAGGGLDASNFRCFGSGGGNSGGQGGTRGLDSPGATTGTIATFPGNPGFAGVAFLAGGSIPIAFGGGGGGGAGSAKGSTASGYNSLGGLGGFYGAGGGGGSGHEQGATISSNAGGVGRQGIVIVISYFSAAQAAVGGGVS